MIDLVDFHAKLAARIVAEGGDSKILFGREHADRHDNQGPGTANRIVVYHGTPDNPQGEWVRRGPTKKRHVRAQPGKLLEWERVSIDLWAFDKTAPEDSAKQYRALRAMYQCVSRNVWHLVRAENHDSTFLEDGADLRDLPIRQHGRRAVLTFEIAFENRAPGPTQLHTAVPDVSSAVVTPTGNVIEEPE